MLIISWKMYLQQKKVINLILKEKLDLNKLNNGLINFKSNTSFIGRWQKNKD